MPALALAELSREELIAEIEALRSELADEKMQRRRVTLTARDQARAIVQITDDCPDWAPSIALIYWLWSDASRAKPSWRLMWARITPLVSAIGELPAPKFAPLVWEHHRARRKLAGLCDATINLELGYAKQMLNWAVDHGLIKHNPLQRAKLVRVKEKREARLTPDDIEKILAVSDDVVNRSLKEGDDTGFRAPLLRAFVICIFDCLLRFNEARLLKLDRIRPDGSYKLLASETKSKEERVFKFTPRALEAIREIQRPDGAVYVLEGPPGFPGSKRKWGLIGEHRMRDWFIRACDLAGINAKVSRRDRRFRPHDGRAGGATTLDENGARARAIQKILGHVDLRTTQRYLRSEAEENATHVCEIMTEATRVGPKKAKRRKIGSRR